MRYLIYMLSIFAMPAFLKAQRIADVNLATAIRWQCPACIDTSNTLTLYAQTIKSITLSNNITDLTGIQGFSNLTSLNASDNNLTFLPALPSGLTTLRCANNQLTALPTLPIGLTGLYCFGNKLTKLPNLPINLVNLDCSRNDLMELPKLPNTLESFYCSYNNLTGLPPLPNSITDIGFSNNNIFILPDLLPPNIFLLSCFNNPNLKCLPKLPNTLKYLELSATITCLPNAVQGLTIYRNDAAVFNTILLPVCTNSCGKTNAVSESLAEIIRVFPSNTEGVLKIENNNIIIDKILIFNKIGQNLLSTNNLELDITKFPAGIYFVQIQVKAEKVMKKIIKL